MRAKKWLSLLALLGVLVHAAALVRHYTVMAGAAGQSPAVAALLADLASGNVICHGAGTLPDEQPGEAPSKSNPVCPLCSSFAPLAALETPDHVFVACPAPAGMRVAYADEAGRPVYAIRPHSRGPPRA